MWATRWELGLHGEEDTAAQHSEEYLLWFGENMIMFIGRGENAEQPAVATQADGPDMPDGPSVPKKHVRTNWLLKFEHNWCC